jgi:kojibiose phosphorylase
MMLYLLRDQFSEEVKRANWEYYESRTAHDSSLSAMAYSLVAAELGMVDWAYKYFLRTSHVDLDSYGPHWNLGIHAAGLGGAWQALVHGFCRLERGDDALVIRDFPRLPEQWTKIRFQFIHLGQRFAITVRHDAMEVEHIGGIEGITDAAFAIEYRGDRTEYPAGGTASLAP